MATVGTLTVKITLDTNEFEASVRRCMQNIENDPLLPYDLRVKVFKVRMEELLEKCIDTKVI